MVIIESTPAERRAVELGKTFESGQITFGDLVARIGDWNSGQPNRVRDGYEGNRGAYSVKITTGRQTRTLGIQTTPDGRIKYEVK